MGSKSSMGETIEIFQVLVLIEFWLYQTGSCSGNAPHVHLGGAWLNTWPDNWLSGMRVFVVVPPSPSHLLTLSSGHDLLQILSDLLVDNNPIIGCCVAFNTDSVIK